MSDPNPILDQLPTPLLQVYKAVRDAFILDPVVAAVVKAANFPDLSDPQRPIPIKTSIMDGDLPEVVLGVAGVNPQPCATSQGSRITIQFTVRLATAKLNLFNQLRVEWALFVASVRQKSENPRLGLPFVEKVTWATRGIGVNEDVEATRGVPGWASAGTVDVACVFTTKDLLCRLPPA